MFSTNITGPIKQPNDPRPSSPANARAASETAHAGSAPNAPRGPTTDLAELFSSNALKLLEIKYPCSIHASWGTLQVRKPEAGLVQVNVVGKDGSPIASVKCRNAELCLSKSIPAGDFLKQFGDDLHFIKALTGGLIKKVTRLESSAAEQQKQFDAIEQLASGQPLATQIKSIVKAISGILTSSDGTPLVRRSLPLSHSNGQVTSSLIINRPAQESDSFLLQVAGTSRYSDTASEQVVKISGDRISFHLGDSPAEVGEPATAAKHARSWLLRSSTIESTDR